MTHYDTEIIAYNSVIIVTGFADGLTMNIANFQLKTKNSTMIYMAKY